MSTQKKTTTKSPFNRKTKAKAPEPKAKYSLGQKLFTIAYHKGRPENILEVKVSRRTKTELNCDYLIGRTKEVIVSFDYFCSTPDGCKTFLETELIPSFQQAASKFAEIFLIRRPS
jgi:hypothetical protein